ncbi:hypothetical protein [Nocardioides sp.]|uniref:hypothetical protein n=1 Tax=Nocardioides sp. TaxID=35761 RepID=UPI002732D7CE|nr:hypothetical protein [Nocardioides sp.]MDP3894165.1 hypothetical protein [Nocardioides sp.]
MAVGIVLIIIGAVFAFAIKAESSWLDTQVLGVILILGGAGFIWRSTTRRRRVVTQQTETPDAVTRSEETTVVERQLD